MKLLQHANYVCMGGENASENWSLLDGAGAEPTDYFLHLASFPSGYVILSPTGTPGGARGGNPGGARGGGPHVQKWYKISQYQRYHG